MLFNRLVQLGAQSFCARGEGNEQHPEGYTAGLRLWLIELSDALTSQFLLPDGLKMLTDEVHIAPVWSLREASTNQQTSCSVTTQSPFDGLEHPLPHPIPIEQSVNATVVRNERVTALTHDQDVRLLDLELDELHEYGQDAVAVIHPKNFPTDVDNFIDMMDWASIADKPLELASRLSVSNVKPQSPLDHLDLTVYSLTIRNLLTDVLDLMAIPRRQFFCTLCQLAKRDTEDEELQSDRLIELADLTLIDELWDYTTRPRRTILEVMADFTTIKIPWQHMLEYLPLMRGRQFSIASGGRLKRSGRGRTRAQLLVAIANPPSPIIKHRRRHGICTRYIASLCVGQKLNITIETPHSPGTMQAKHDGPLIMIGPGTGVAPLRCLIYERLFQRQALAVLDEHAILSDTILFFGCRSPTADFYFKDEWQALAEKHGLVVHTAFSRHTSTPKTYVQDVIGLYAPKVAQMLQHDNCKIYVCGSSGNMPKAVRQALVDAINGEHTQSDDLDHGEKILDKMVKQKRYQQETWS